MVNTPICDFLGRYAESGSARFHMPGHKGKLRLGFEAMDITEFDGADDLFSPEGIIAESEEIASALFGCPTVYSCGGSTLMIQAMLALAASRGGCILAGRNAHKSLLNAAVLLDMRVEWLYPRKNDPDCVCSVTPEALEERIRKIHPSAVYLTSPDYLGNISEIKEIARVCHKHGIWLLVDNAHGAYLHFLQEALHPMDLGADLCCDSAHKTLPVITGGAYLHLSERASRVFSRQRVKDAMALFGSTSPSYLIMASLDAANPYMEELPEKLRVFIPKVDALKERLKQQGYQLVGSEPLKITLDTLSYGYSGDEIAKILLSKNIVSEFHDPEFIVFMITPENSDQDLARLKDALLKIPRRKKISEVLPERTRLKATMSPRQAVFAKSETIPAGEAAGRVLASARIGCPPAIPLAMAGEVLDENTIKRMIYYGIEECRVVKEGE